MRFIMLIMSLMLMLTACKNTDSEQFKAVMSQKAQDLDVKLIKFKADLKTVSVYAESLYKNQTEIIKHIDKSKYDVYDNTIFYKKNNDLGSAVFVSGYYPLTDSIKSIVYFTEPLDIAFQDLMSKNVEITQIYYNDRHSYNRIYPWFDVLTQYQWKIDICQFNFYYMADKSHNPQAKTLCLNESYLDPAGRGWIFSIISPVYYKEKLEGVLGIDLKTDDFLEKTLNISGYYYLVVQNNGLVIANSPELSLPFGFPERTNANYLERITKEEQLEDVYNLQNSKIIELRELNRKIAQGNEFAIKIVDKKYQVYVKNLREINWKIVYLKG